MQGSLGSESAKRVVWDPGIPGTDLDDQAQLHLTHKPMKLKLPGMTDKVASMRSGCVNINKSLFANS